VRPALRWLVVLLGVLGSPLAAQAQTPVRVLPGLTLQIDEAHERGNTGTRTQSGVMAVATRSYQKPRFVVGGTARARVRGTQSLEGTSRIQLSSRTTLGSTYRMSYATREGDVVGASGWSSSGFAAATTSGLAHQVSRRTTVGVSYRFDRVRYLPASPATLAQGVGVGIWRAHSRYLTWQAGYDFGWSGARSHAAVLQARYQLPHHEGTAVTLALRPTISVGGVQRTSVVAGLVRVDHVLDEHRRIGFGYERSVSLLEFSDRAVVADVISAHLDARTRRLSVAASVLAARSRRINAVVRVNLRVAPRAALFGEFTHAGYGGGSSFTRTTVRFGATLAVTGRTLE
jgi:hypothetical protein